MQTRKCGSCGYQSPASQKKCQRCGTPLGRCPECGQGFDSDELLAEHRLREQDQTERIGYAGFWIRLFAFVVDGVPLWIIAYVLSRVFSPSTVVDPIVLLIGFAYFTLSSGPHLKGQSLGKRLVRIKVVSVDGGPLSYWHAAVRSVPIVVILFSPYVTRLALVPDIDGLIWITAGVAFLVFAVPLTVTLHPQKRGIHELFNLGTVCVTTASEVRQLHPRSAGTWFSVAMLVAALLGFAGGGYFQAIDTSSPGSSFRFSLIDVNFGTTSKAGQHVQDGAQLLQTGRFDEALAKFDEAIRLEDDLTEAYNGRGLAYLESGQPLKAIQDFDKAIQLDPKYAPAYNNRGAAYMNLDQPQRAVVELTEAIRLNAQYAGAYAWRALASTLLGDDVKAEEDVARALELGADRASLEQAIAQSKARR